jgi:hypothetical protein
MVDPRITQIMEAADKYWEASTAARYRVRSELEAVVSSLLQAASQAQQQEALTVPADESALVGRNVYLPHPLMVTSGKFWRCDHGNTGLGPNAEWVGCAQCRAALVAPTQAQQPAQQTDLHAAILNLPDGILPDAAPEKWLDGFRKGHRAARHQAAELVAAAPQQPAQQAVRMLTEERVVAIAKQLFGPDENQAEGAWGENSLDMVWVKAIAMPLVRAIEAAHGIALPPAAKEGEKKQ